MSVKPSRTNMRDYDLLLVCAVVVLLVFGLIMVFSASIALSDGPKYVNADRYFFFTRHLVFIIVGILAGVLTSFVPMQFWERNALPLYGLSIFFLVLVLVPGIGREVNGASRWIPIGPVNFQSSELTKLAMVIFCSWYIGRKKQYMRKVRGLLPILGFLGIAAMLLLAEPDLGATMVVAAIVFGLLFLGGVSLKVFVALIGIAVAGIVGLIVTAPWRLQRIFAYLDPFSAEHAQSTGYQLSHSLIAVGRGEIFGVGLGFSIEKLHYLPEAHTDFIMAVVAEELGFVGIMGVIILFAIIVKKGLVIGRHAVAMDREFNGLVAQGIAVWFGVQAFINLGVCFGLLPTKGLTLPLVSYGGSALVMNMIAVAVLLRIDYENRCMMRGQNFATGRKGGGHV
ncbi:putative lipid II flippase FtsW [Pelistega europaea]|uniref:Probable peptidoglycan glycosyltransferase FtsW n=1 Tax=Pelistega europaea TaxID=106147 RepID=A0A7Y4LB85_9BURK|nr:putative lipid II flippase FtsW [Pelistega europaea]NOL49237.1 putative lipid II flippase FtsW [Pelistega europaea]